MFYLDINILDSLNCMLLLFSLFQWYLGPIQWSLDLMLRILMTTCFPSGSENIYFMKRNLCLSLGFFYRCCLFYWVRLHEPRGLCLSSTMWGDLVGIAYLKGANFRHFWPPDVYSVSKYFESSMPWTLILPQNTPKISRLYLSTYLAKLGKPFKSHKFSLIFD